MKQWIATILVAVIFAPITAHSANEVRTEQVHFKSGTSSATIKGSIKGYEYVDYQLTAAEGQVMVVDLKTSNLSSYFNILPDGATQAWFNGSIDSNHFMGALPADGRYTIRVYLMRNAARRNEVAQYTLTIRIKEQGKQDSATPSDTTGPADVGVARNQLSREQENP